MHHGLFLCLSLLNGVKHKKIQYIDPVDCVILEQLSSPDLSKEFIPSFEDALIEAIDQKYNKIISLTLKTILNLKKQGFNNKEIALKMGCKESNIRYHIKKYCDFSSKNCTIIISERIKRHWLKKQS